MKNRHPAASADIRPQNNSRWRRLRRTPLALLVLVPVVSAAGCTSGDATEWTCKDFGKASAEARQKALDQLAKKWFNDAQYKGALGHFRAGNNLTEEAMKATLGRLIQDECAKHTKGHQPAHPALRRLANSDGAGDLPPEPAATPSPAPSPQGTPPGPGARAPSDQGDTYAQAPPAEPAEPSSSDPAPPSDQPQIVCAGEVRDPRCLQGTGTPGSDQPAPADPPPAPHQPTPHQPMPHQPTG